MSETATLVDELRARFDQGHYIPWEEVIAFLNDPVEDEHPGEPHEFRTICRRCRQPGMLHVSLITSGEHVHIEPAGKPLARTGEPT